MPDGDVYHGPGTRERPEWVDPVVEAGGEDPTRFLLAANTAPALVHARIDGIVDVDTALFWIYCERRLGMKRPGIIGRLNRRIKELRSSERRLAPREITFEDKEVVFLEHEYDDEGDVVDVHRYTPEEWHSRSASAKVARMRTED